MARLIEQAHGQTIQLGLTTESQRLALPETILDAAAKGQQILGIEDVIQGEHGLLMAHRAKGAQCRPTDPLSRGVMAHQLRMLDLQGQQLPEQAIIFGIGNRGRIQHIIFMFVTGQHADELAHPGFDISHGADS